MERLKESLRNSPIIEKDGYHYFVHPITDGIPELDPNILREIVDEVVKHIDVDKIDKIIVPEAMGIHIGTSVSLEIDKPLLIARKKSYGFEDEVSVKQVTGYSENDLYINYINEGDKVVLLDDVISTGGTLKSMVKALDSIGAEIINTIIIIQKGDIPNLPIDIETLIKIELENEEIKIK